MNLSFEKQVALVTGAASGMGLAAAQAFAAEGAAVVLADVNESAARAVAQQLVTAGHKAIAIRCDVADEAQGEGDGGADRLHLSDGWMRRSITPASKVPSRKSPTLPVKN